MNINIEREVQTVLKEGFLDKQSRILKSWRRFTIFYLAVGLYLLLNACLHLKTEKYILPQLKSSPSKPLHPLSLQKKKFPNSLPS